jgi:hypothetical protein
MMNPLITSCGVNVPRINSWQDSQSLLTTGHISTLYNVGQRTLMAAAMSWGVVTFACRPGTG